MARRSTVLAVFVVLVALRSPTVRSEEVGEGGEGQPRFVGELHNVSVPLGRDTVLTCTVENLKGFKVAWVQVDTQTVLTIHRQVISRNPRISLLHNDARTWHLYLTNVREKDRGWYMCQVNTDPMLYRQAYLDVVVPPDIIDRESSGDLTIREGEDVTLTCRARGHPTPSVLWRREDNQNIILDENNTVREVEGDTLVMKKVSRLQMGSYLCIAVNGVPPSISKRTHLTVQFPPMVWVPQQLESAYPGQELTIECHTEAFPKSINYWTNPLGDMIVAEPGYEPVVTEESLYKVYMKLKIQHLRRQDFGGYRCVAKNSLGETDGAIRIYEREPLQVQDIQGSAGPGETFQVTPKSGVPGGAASLGEEGPHIHHHTHTAASTHTEDRKMIENPAGAKGMDDLSEQLHLEKSNDVEAARDPNTPESQQSGQAAVHRPGPAGRDAAAWSTTTSTVTDHLWRLLLLLLAQFSLLHTTCL